MLGLALLYITLPAYFLVYVWLNFIGFSGTLSFWVSCCLLRVPEFLIGCLLSQYILMNGFNVNPWLKRGLILFSLIYLSISLYYFMPSSFVLSPSIAILIYLLIVSKNKIIKKLFENKGAILLGEISYSIYLFHYLFIDCTILKKGEANHFYWRPVIFTLFTLFISFCVYKAFEVPMRKMIKKKFSIIEPENKKEPAILNASPLDPQERAQ